MLISPNPHYPNALFGTENTENIADSGKIEPYRQTAMVCVGYDESRSSIIKSGRKVYIEDGMVGRKELISFVGEEEKDWIVRTETPIDVTHGANNIYVRYCNFLLYDGNLNQGDRNAAGKEGVAYLSFLLNTPLVKL